MRIRVVNKTASSVGKITAALRDSSNTVQQYVVYQIPVYAGEVLEFDASIPPSRKLSVVADTANVFDIVTIDAVRQYWDVGKIFII